MDDPREPGAERPSRARLRAGRHRTRSARCSRKSASKHASSSSASRATSSPRRRVRSSRTCAFIIRSHRRIRSTSARRRSISAIRDDRHRHRHRALVAGLRRRGLRVLQAHGMDDPTSSTRCMGDGRYIESLPLFGGLTIWEANPQDRRSAARTSARCCTPKNTRTATCTAGATRRRSSIARRRSGSPAWTDAEGRRRRRCARRRCAGIEATAFYPRGASSACTA